MAISIEITSDGTIEGTRLKVDGKDITKTEKVANIDFYAHGKVVWPDGYTSVPGIHLNYRTIEEDDGLKGVSHSFSPENSEMKRTSIGPPKDSEGPMVGRTIDPRDAIADELIALAKDKTIAVPSREVLLQRTEASLRDKLQDLKDM